MFKKLNEKEIYDTLNYQPHLLGILRFSNGNDLLQEYTSKMNKVNLNTKKIFNKFLENPLYNINYQNEKGDTLLHILIKKKQIQLVIDILNMSLVNNKPAMFLKNNKNETLIHLVCTLESQILLRELLDYLHKTNQSVSLLDETDYKNKTPINICIKNKNEKMLEDLLRNGANPKYFVSENYIPLHYAIQNRFKKAILILIKYGAQKFTPSYLNKSLIEKTKSKFAINLIN